MIRDEVRQAGDIMGELEGETTERVGQVSHKAFDKKWDHHHVHITLHHYKTRSVSMERTLCVLT